MKAMRYMQEHSPEEIRSRMPARYRVASTIQTSSSQSARRVRARTFRAYAFLLLPRKLVCKFCSGRGCPASLQNLKLLELSLPVPTILASGDVFAQ
jgi:hypothetical protein